MALPRTLLITHYPIGHRNGSIHHIHALLDRYSNQIVWYSTKPPRSDATQYQTKVPYQHGELIQRPHRVKRLRDVVNTLIWARQLGKQAASFGRQYHVQVVLAQLSLEAVVASLIAAKRLAVPLAVFIADHPPSLLEVAGYPRWFISLFERRFEEALRLASSHAVISQSMANFYHERYHIDPTVLYVGVGPSDCGESDRRPSSSTTVTIGSVGSVVSPSNWAILLDAVRTLNQKHHNKSFRVLHVGDLAKELRAPEVHVTGWVDDAQVPSYLCQTDLNFLNLWFEDEYAILRRTSFPTKIHSYISVKRPIVALGPRDSSVAQFVEKYSCGVTCTTPNSLMLAQLIEQLVFSDEAYRSACEGVTLVQTVFSPQSFYHNFEQFINRAFLRN